MRVFAEETYGIIPEHVIGSYGSVKYETKDGKPTFMKSVDTVFVDDKNGKPEAIHRFIGRRPIAAFGNSDGDQAMIEYTTLENPRPSLGVIIHHTDADRQYAYDANSKSSGKLVTGLQAAPANGWVVVDMADDWSAVLPESKDFRWVPRHGSDARCLPPNSKASSIAAKSISTNRISRVLS